MGESQKTPKQPQSPLAVFNTNKVFLVFIIGGCFFLPLVYSSCEDIEFVKRPGKIDTTPPTIIINTQKSVRSITEQDTAKVYFVAKDEDSGVAKILCRAAQVDAIEDEKFGRCKSPFIINILQGSYQFEAKALDKEGNESSVATHNWCRGPMCGRVAHTGSLHSSVQNDKVGILFVVDNSSSMEQEHRALARHSQKFLKKFADLNYKVAVSVTEYHLKKNAAHPFRAIVSDGDCSSRSSTASGSGEMDFIINSHSADLEQAAADLSATIKCVGIKGHSQESGLGSFLALINTYDSSTAESRASNGLDFFDDLQHLVVVLISDEGDKFAHKKNISASDIKTRFHTVFPDTSFLWHSFLQIKHVLNPPMHLYKDIADLTQGSVQDVLDTAAYGTVLTGIADLTRKHIMRARLQCAPVNYQNPQDYDPENPEHRLMEVLDSQGTPLSPQPMCKIDRHLKVQCFSCSDPQDPGTCDTPLDVGEYTLKYQCSQTN